MNYGAAVFRTNLSRFSVSITLSICLLNVFLYFTVPSVPSDRQMPQQSTRATRVAPFLGLAAGTHRSTPRVFAETSRVVSTESVVFECLQGEDPFLARFPSGTIQQ